MFKKYEETVLELSKYPHANELTINAALYPAFGLVGEATEALEKFYYASDRNEIVKELGDVLWYITRLSAELGSSLTELINHIDGEPYDDNEDDVMDHFINMIASSGRCAEHVKKTIRDDHSDLNKPFNLEREKKILQELHSLLTSLTRITTLIHSSIEEISFMNMDKLLDRNNRGMIHGEGDNR